MITAGTLVLGSGTAVAAGPTYVALGDSYSSGTGTRTYINDGTSCQRSLAAYPELLAPQIGASLSFQACSGAKTADVLNNQLGTLSADTAYVTISIGGNDAGFSSVISRCALPWPFSCTQQIIDAQNFIVNTLPARLDAVYNAISSKAPNARVAVVGYPRLFNGQTCNELTRISAGEEASLNTTADMLATATADRAAAHGFTFVDPRSTFDQHEICANLEWLNGLSYPIGESFHPNVRGQSAYDNLVLMAIA